MLKSFLASAVMALSLAAGSAGAATLTLGTGDELLGATGVDVGGSLYDVTFADGTCAGVFGACAESAFDFNTVGAATAAAQALLDQVFTGIFDSNPENTFGCGSLSQCIVVIPYLINMSSQRPLVGVVARNTSIEANDATGPTGLFLDFDLAGKNSAGADNNLVFARFTPAQVPVPAAGFLLVFAIGGLAALRRRSAV